VIAHVERKPDQSDHWLKDLLARRNKNIVAVALAAKNARIAWALLAHERGYQPDHVTPPATAQIGALHWTSQLFISQEVLSAECSGNHDVMAR
jgi:hypothetical protein